MSQQWDNSFALQAPEHETVEKDHFTCIVVDGKGDDLIFQFFNVKIDDFEEVIAEVIEEHFGNTNGFAIEYVSELKMYGLLYKDAKDTPLFSRDFHVHAFLDILDSTITELQK